jgi:hypothetical protein
MKRISLHVEKQIAGIGPGQPSEAAAGLAVKDLGFVFVGLPFVHLQRRLGAESLENLRVKVWYVGCFRQCGQVSDSSNTGRLQLDAL